MPIDAEELADRFYALGDEIGIRLTPIEEEVRYAHDRTDTITGSIEALKAEFDAFKVSLIDDFNTLIDKLQMYARAQDLVDEQGSSLDEFLESFRRY